MAVETLSLSCSDSHPRQLKGCKSYCRRQKVALLRARRRSSVAAGTQLARGARNRTTGRRPSSVAQAVALASWRVGP
ncbi:hypothetical protein J6590_062105 [Homalodisca vitripennis]|nr:hypothetical protein J6590_062105 [Homalodisca vitripennis]